MNWLVEPLIRKLMRYIALLCVLTSGFFFVDSSWIYTKAILAQQLIKQAWQQTIADGEFVKPWPWADTWPVGRLQVTAYDVDLYILNGDQGSTLAFGPGMMTHSSYRGDAPIILAGHRDTHFRFMEKLKQGDRLGFTDTSGQQHFYVIRELSIEDSNKQRLSITDNEALILITCYPFDVLDVGGPQRYVARAVSETAYYQL